jgi:hypothetical protein
MSSQPSGIIKALIASQERTRVKVLLSQLAVINSRFKQSTLIVIFKWIIQLMELMES